MYSLKKSSVAAACVGAGATNGTSAPRAMARAVRSAKPRWKGIGRARDTSREPHVALGAAHQMARAADSVSISPCLSRAPADNGSMGADPWIDSFYRGPNATGPDYVQP